MSERPEAHSSDIQTAISRLHMKNNLIGYRNLLSYTTALNIRIFPSAKVNRHLWSTKGSGTYSEVFETSLESEPPKEVIIKRPNASFTRDDVRIENLVQHQALSNIVRELRILTHQDLKNHDNLIHIFGIYLDEEDNPVGTRPCIVFEKALMTLSTYLIDTSVQHSENYMLAFSADVTAGLSAIHSHGLVHGDLKPENILMVFRNDRVTCALADFGTCGTSGQSVEEDGIIPGTPGFCAPEYYRSSCFHHWVNMPTRDVYGLGLIIFSIATNNILPPFRSDSEKLQRDDVACLEYLRQQIVQHSAADLPWDIIQHCVRANPEKRWSLPVISGILRKAQGLDAEYNDIRDLAQQLLTNPPDPRVRVLDDIKPSTHLHAKLLSEYELACDGEIDARLAITMAALYAGVIGPPVEHPYNFVAKAQWLLKAIELGHLPTVSTIYDDDTTFKLIESCGQSLIFFRRPSQFKSPLISVPLLLDRLEEAAIKPDIIALNLLVFLGGNIPDHVQFDRQISPSATSLQRRLIGAFPALDEAPYYEKFLQRELQIIDSDAVDLMIGTHNSELLRYAYNDDLEGFVQAAESISQDGVPSLLHYAILGGSSNVIRYILEHFRFDPNAFDPNGVMEEVSSEADQMDVDSKASDEEDPEMSQDEMGSEPEEVQDDESRADSAPDFHFFERLDRGMRFFEFALSLGRPSVVQTFIEYDATIIAASGDKPSSLHFLARFDDEQLTAIVCGSCADKHNLREIVESKPSTGPLEGISALEINLNARRWRNVLMMLRKVTGRFSTETQSVLLFAAVTPMHPAPPFVLSAFLDYGFDPNLVHQSPNRAQQPARPPLYWAIGTSNVLAVATLLIHGASTSSSGDIDLVSFAKECLDEVDCYREPEVYDEQGEVCEGGLERMKIAARAVYELIFLGRRKEGDWKETIEQYIANCPDDCKEKTWIPDKTDPAEVTMVLEVFFGTE
ncbi:hypothetical protein BCR34DRAFT_607185 [Clohesyomyces aquaticus]|uniref:Protein kinase domain-containing protein n=1 Tax=Clohesyomyces aquaticus TaxID=1231657 RepID=A0A1Y1YI22_9PLEO|nr:hypothetical protein BCR34DRAFT_607185 [Clohesyomyces aquaticus]